MLSAIPRKNWSVSYELEDTGQTVVFDEVRSELMVFNETAAAVWLLVDGERSVGAIVEFLQRELPVAVPEERMQEDVLQFLRGMVERGGISLHEQTDVSGA